VVTGGNVAKPSGKIWQHLLEYVAYVISLKNGKMLPNLKKWLPNFQMWHVEEYILFEEKMIKNIRK